MNKLFSSLTILSLLLLASGPAQAITYAVTDLGTLGGTRSSANGINNSGQVVGTSYVEGTNYYHAFLYSDGTMTDLGTFGGQDPSSASAINNIGQIVGWFTGSDGKQHSFRTAPYSSINPNTDEIAGGSANAINSKGQVVGVSYYGYLTAPNGRFDDTAINLGYGSNPNGINDSSYVVGSNGGAYLYNSNRPTEPAIDLGTLGGGWGSTWAQDINNSGQIIGTSELSSGYWHAFLTSPYTPINPATDDLGPIGGNSGAAAINAHGQVVGNISMDSYPWDTSHTHAFLYSDSTMIDLNTLIDPLSGWTLQSATDINDSGQIVGWGVGPNFGPNEAHAFLLTPIPEPSILILLGITSVSLLVFKLASSTKRCYYRL